MKNFVLFLTVFAMAGSACAGIIVQSSLDTTPVQIVGPGTAEILPSSPGIYTPGQTTVFHDSPSGQPYYIQGQGAAAATAEYEYLINKIIPDGTYTVEVTWGTSSYTGDLMAMNIWASADAITNGRVSFTGGSAHQWHSGFPSDSPDGWRTENIIGPDNWFSGIYFNRVPYESVTISGYQAGDLSFALADWSGGAYDRVSWDTLEFIPEPATMALLGLGSIVLLRRKK